MLKIYKARRLNDLANYFIQKRGKRSVKNFLEPEWMVVQNHGMGQWLSFFIAERKGIAANFDFKFPAEISWDLLRKMDPSIPKTLPSEKDPMAWALMQMLQHDDHPLLAELHRYTSRREADEEEMRRWQLAQRIAAVFDEYLTFRPHMLLQWEQHNLQYDDEAERWQAYLWQKLTKLWKKRGAYMHRAQLQTKLMESLHSDRWSNKGLPRRVMVFGVSSMPPVFLKMLVQLAGQIDVHFYNSVDMMDSKHPLVQSFGRNGRTFNAMLQKYIGEVDQMEVQTETITSTDDEATSLLYCFKSQLWKKDLGKQKPAFDRTIQVQICHSRRREVEVLQNQLLAIMEEDASINPSDILILAPDMQTYRPHVERVFGTQEQDLPDLPFHFSEHQTHHAVADGFIVLMQTADSRLGVTGVLDVLHHPAVKKQFNFNGDEINTLERWIDKTNIRWGMDEEQKAALNLPQSPRFTWQAGLNSMMLGYAMDPHDDELYQNIYPFPEIEQSENIHLAGRFSRFLNALFRCHKQVNKPRGLTDWHELLLRWITQFFPNQEPYVAQVQRLREQISNLKKNHSLTAFSGKVSFPIIRAWLTDHVEHQSVGGSQSGRGITFSDMQSMRNIPAQVICVLGLQDDAFPRSDDPVSFDLIAKHPKKGDRKHSWDDRQLFLEILLAARKRLYFSYIGQSDRQDTDYPPSVVLQETIDYLTEYFDLDERALVIRQRLQAFSPQYFTEDKKQLFSYSSKQKRMASSLLCSSVERKSFIIDRLDEPDASFKQLPVDRLIHYFSHPARFLLQNRLGIYLKNEKMIDEDRESFGLDNLGAYQLGQHLLDHYLRRKSLEKFKKVAFARQILPEGWPGIQAFDQIAEETTVFARQLEEYIPSKKSEPLEIDIALQDFVLTGRLQNIYESEQIFYRYGRARAKDFIHLWIYHLIFQLIVDENHPCQSLLITHDSKQGFEVHRLQEVHKPRDVLHKILLFYWQGLQSNTLFFPATSYAYAKAIIKGEKSEDKALKVAHYQWQNDHTPFDMEGDDRYNTCLLRNVNFFDDSGLRDTFEKISIQFWHPFFNVYETT